MTLLYNYVSRESHKASENALQPRGKEPKNLPLNFTLTCNYVLFLKQFRHFEDVKVEGFHCSGTVHCYIKYVTIVQVISVTSVNVIHFICIIIIFVELPLWNRVLLGRYTGMGGGTVVSET